MISASTCSSKRTMLRALPSDLARSATVAAGHRHQHFVECLLCDRNATNRSRFAGGVGIECESDPTCELLDLMDVFLGYGAADAGDDIAIAALCRHDHIQIAFDYHDLVMALDGFTSEIQAIERSALVEEQSSEEYSDISVGRCQARDHRRRWCGSGCREWERSRPVAKIIVETPTARALSLPWRILLSISSPDDVTLFLQISAQAVAIRRVTEPPEGNGLVVDTARGEVGTGILGVARLQELMVEPDSGGLVEGTQTQTGGMLG